MTNQDQVTLLVDNFTKLIIHLFELENKLIELDINYDEDLICTLKDDFINKYRLVLTEEQIEAIFAI